MDKSRKRMRSAMLLTTVALAGSAGATFNFSFGASGGEARPPQGGTKSDAGTTSGNHASVRVTESWELIMHICGLAPTPVGAMRGTRQQNTLIPLACMNLTTRLQ